MLITADEASTSTKMYQTVTTLIVTLLLTSTASTQWTQVPTQYVQPHELLHELKLAKAALPSLLESEEEIRSILDALADVRGVLRRLAIFNVTLSETCANDMVYMSDAALAGGKGNTWAMQSESV